MDPLTRLAVAARALLARLDAEEDGFSTAELLANAALGVIALVVIWGLLQTLGVDIVDMIRTRLVAN